MKWFRFYNEALDDPKVQRLHPAMFKHWVNLLCLASEYDKGGELPDEAAIAFRLRLRPYEARKVMDRLVTEELLDVAETSPRHRRLVVHNWAGRQMQSDSSAARVARYRAGNRENVTLPVTATVTTPEKEVDTDTPTVEKPKKNESTNPAHILVRTLSERTGVKVTSWPKSTKLAKQLVDVDVTPEELMSMVTWLENEPYWAGKGCDLGIIVSQLEKFRSSQRAPKLVRGIMG